MVPVCVVCMSSLYFLTFVIATASIEHSSCNNEKCSDYDVTNDCLDRGSTIEYRYEVGSLFYIYYIFKAEL